VDKSKESDTFFMAHGVVNAASVVIGCDGQLVWMT